MSKLQRLIDQASEAYRYQGLFRAEPLRTENSWRVMSGWGALVAFRLSREDAEEVVEALNKKALTKAKATGEGND